MKLEDELAIITLAAGSSSRMGQPKQLLPIGSETLLRYTTKISLATGIQKVIVVLNEKSKHQNVIDDLQISIAVSENSEMGIGSSIKSGLTFSLKRWPHLTGVIILVCDQPLLSANHILKLIDLHIETQKPIIASTYAKTTGVPALFHRSYFDKLLLLEDHGGAKKLILGNINDVSSIDFPEGEFDLDTMEDYNTFIKRKLK